MKGKKWDAYQVHCPYCGAVPDYQCVVKGRSYAFRISKPHKARLDAYERAMKRGW